MTTSQVTNSNGHNGAIWQKLGIGLIALLFLKESYSLVEKTMAQKSQVDIPALFKQQEIMIGNLSQVIRDQNEINKDTSSVMRQISGTLLIMTEKQLQHFQDSSEFYRKPQTHTTP